LVWSGSSRDFEEPQTGLSVWFNTVRFWFASGPNHELDLNTNKGHLDVAQLFFGQGDVDVNSKDEGL
jgi:hypothetical protein